MAKFGNAIVKTVEVPEAKIEAPLSIEDAETGRAITQGSNAKFGSNLAAVPTMETDKANAYLEGMRSQMNQIQAITKNPETKLNMISQFALSLAGTRAEVQKSIADRVRQESGIDQLEQQLKDVQEFGLGNFTRNYITHRYGGVPRERSILMQINQKMALMEDQLKIEAATNPTLQAISAIEATHGFLNTQSALATKEINTGEAAITRQAELINRTAEARETAGMNREASTEVANINREATFENSKLLITAQQERAKEDREMKVQEEKQLYINALDQDQMHAAVLLSGKDSTDPRIGDFILANKSNKDFTSVLNNVHSPEDMTTLALSGNPLAKNFMINRQAELISGVSDRNNPKFIKELAVAKNDLKEMSRVMTSPKQFEAAKDRVYGVVGTPMRDKWENQQQLAALVAPGTKAAADRNNKIRAELARDFLAVVNQDLFKTDIDSWGDQFTATLKNDPIYVKLVEDKGKGNVGVDDYVESVMTLKDPQEKAQQMRVFEEVMSQAAAEKNRAYFGFALDTLAVRGALDRSITRSLRGDLSAIVETNKELYSAIARGLNTGGIGGAVREVGRKIFKDIDEKTQLMDYITGSPGE